MCYNRETKGIDEGLAFQILEKLTIFHLRDFMIKDINLSVNHLRLIPVLLESSDFEIFALIKSTNTAYLITEGELFDYKFYQGLSSVLTIFSHDLLNIQQLLTIWDFIFSYNSVLASIYVYTSTLMYFKDDIFKKLGLALDDEFQDFDKIDKDLVHTMLSPGNLFANIKDRDLIKILNKAEMLIEKFPLIDGELKVSDVEWDVDEKTKSGHLHISDESDKPEIDSFVVASDSIPEVQKVHVDPSWFEFNKHSVLFTSSTICSNLIDRNKANSKYQNLFNRDFLDEWIQTQDDEVSKQSLFEVQLQQEILDRQMQSQQQEQQELSTSTSDFSGSILLSSSLSSLSTVASSSALSTSVLIKKLLRVGRDDDNDDELNDTLDRKKAVSIYNASNIYKVSFTIGFIGFMAHFLLMRSNTRYFEVTRHIGGHIEELSSIGTGLIRDVSHGLSNAFRETTNGGILGHIGIGNIRNMIYGLH